MAKPYGVFNYIVVPASSGEHSKAIAIAYIV